jgi:hypothetical protein
MPPNVEKAKILNGSIQQICGLSVNTMSQIIGLRNLGFISATYVPFHLFQNVQSGNWPFRDFCWMHTGGLFAQRQISWGTNLTDHLHTVPILRMDGTIPPLHHISWDFNLCFREMFIKYTLQNRKQTQWRKIISFNA